MILFSEFNTNSIDITLDFAGYEDCKPKYSVGPAIRDNYVLHFIVSGKGKFQYKGETHHLSAGDMFLLKPDVTIFYQADSDDPWSYYWIGLSGNRIKDYYNFSTISERCYLKRTPQDISKELLICIRSIVDTMNIRLDGADYLFENFSNIYKILGYLRTISPKPLEPKFSASFQLFLNAKQFLLTEYGTDISIQNVADQYNINRSYLFELFVRYENKSPKQLLTQIRMERAKYLLTQTIEPINSIANSVGFSDQLAFSRAFKKYVGKSPSYYRKSLP